MACFFNLEFGFALHVFSEDLGIYHLLIATILKAESLGELSLPETKMLHGTSAITNDLS